MLDFCLRFLKTEKQSCLVHCPYCRSMPKLHQRLFAEDMCSHQRGNSDAVAALVRNSTAYRKLTLAQNLVVSITRETMLRRLSSRLSGTTSMSLRKCIRRDTRSATGTGGR